MTVRRRFIAGAVCPSCRVMDRLVIETEAHDAPRRLCVECGFSETLTEGAETSTGGVPRGRPERPSRPREAASQAVRILDPGASKDGD